MTFTSRLVLLVVFTMLAACSEQRIDVSSTEQAVNGICELLPEHMTYCMFPGGNAGTCFCDQDKCLQIMRECEITDPSWWMYCVQACPVTVIEQPPFNPATDCEELLEHHSVPPWHICNFPRCWDLEPGESCIVPLGGGGGNPEYGGPES